MIISSRVCDLARVSCAAAAAVATGIRITTGEMRGDRRDPSVDGKRNLMYVVFCRAERERRGIEERELLQKFVVS